MSLTDENNVASFQVIPKNRGQWRHKTPLFTIPPENPINSGIKGDEDAPAVNDGKIVKQKPMELSQLRIENGRLKHEINSDIEILKNVLTKRLEMEAASMARMATPEQMESLQLHNENALLKRKANALKKLMDNVNKYSKNVT